MNKALLLSIISLAASVFTGSANSAIVSIVGDRSELSTIQTEFSTTFGDTVTRYNQGWASLSTAQLDLIFASNIVWEGDIFAAIPAAVQTRMINYVNTNHGLFLTAERPCCDTHNTDVQAVGRSVTGDNGLLVGNTGTDIFNHTFSSSPTTILTSPNDIRGQAAQHDGPGRVQPTGGVTSNACFIESGSPAVCTAGAWGPDLLAGGVGRFVIYGDINSQPSLVTNFNGDQFENIRQFLLTGFSGGIDVCITNPNLPGCGPPPPPGSSVPEPGSLPLLALGALALAAFLRRRNSA